MVVDSHIHSEFSFDSGQKTEEIAARLKSLGYRGVLTDHYDFDYAQGNFFSFDVPAFLEQMDARRPRRLFKGIEMGLRPSLRAKHEEHAALKRFDFLLGSVHYAYEDADIVDFSRPIEMNLVPFYYYYFDHVLSAIEDNGFIHALAHLDYPARYQPDFAGEIPLGAVADKLHQCFRAMALREISLEINTARLERKMARLQWRWLLNAYRECGGELVTFGSDAHVAEHIGRHFDVAFQLAEEAKLIPVYYKAGQAYEMREDR